MYILFLGTRLITPQPPHQPQLLTVTEVARTTTSTTIHHTGRTTLHGKVITTLLAQQLIPRVLACTQTSRK